MPSRSSDRKIVVLVEPDAPCREQHRAILEDGGYQVLAFPDYLGALDEAESDRPLDLLITDIHLPVGTPHGISLVAMMRLRRPSLSAIFMTSLDEHLPMIDKPVVLKKPFAASVLLDAVTNLIGGLPLA